jgi:hypothetical protein
MAYTPPTTAGISADIIAGLEASLSQSIPLLPKAFSRVLAKVLAGVYVLLWHYAQFIFFQIFVRYCTNDEVQIGSKVVRPLTEHGRSLGVGDPSAGTRAELNVTVTVTNQTGSLAAGTQLLRSATGVIYAITYAVELDAATVPAVMRAVSDPDGGGGIGDVGNLEAGDVVRFISKPANVSRDVTVVSTAVQGADAEQVEVYRGRVVGRRRNPPQGGAPTDFRIWGEEVDGIVHVYPYKSATPGEMDIYVEATPESSGDPDGIPTEAQLTAVKNAIIYDANGLASRLPGSMDPDQSLNLYAITRTGLEIVISGWDVPADTDSDCRDAVEDACTEYFLSRRPWLLGLDQLPRTDRALAVDVGGIVISIVAAHGGSVTDVEMQPAGGGSPIESYVVSNGETLKLNSSPTINEVT